MSQFFFQPIEKDDTTPPYNKFTIKTNDCFTHYPLRFTQM